MRHHGAARYLAPRPQRTIWTDIGVVLAVLLCAGGLIAVGCLVVLYIAILSIGSNK
jgi:hypothetical protein